MVLNCTICTQIKNPETPSLLQEKLGFRVYSYRGAYKHFACEPLCHKFFIVPDSERMLDPPLNWLNFALSL